MIGTVYHKICSENQLLGENMKTNSKNVFWSFEKLKLGTFMCMQICTHMQKLWTSNIVSE